MLVARLELWQQGNPHSVEVLDTIVIANDGTGTVLRGNYNYAVNHEGVTSRGRITGWNRDRGAIELLVHILKMEGWG